MRRLAVTLLLVAACGRSSSPPPPNQMGAEAAPVAPAAAVAVPEGPGKVLDASFASKALGVTKNYKVYLPAGYDTLASRRYPVVYMLHGLGGDETNWLDGGKIDAVADQLRLQAIIVMPDGDSGFYANSATPADKDACMAKRPIFAGDDRLEDYCVAHARYEDYITQDLVGHVDATYRTIAERRGRGIGGLSMGGFGALQLAMRHKDLFAATASHSGVDALLYAGPFPYTSLDKVVLLEDVAAWGRGVGPIGDLLRGILGSDAANWRAHDPATLAGGLKNGELAIYLDCGTEDRFLLHNGAQYLHDLLTARGVEHEWYLGPGGHDFGFWAERIDDSLAFFTRSLAPAAP